MRRLKNILLAALSSSLAASPISSPNLVYRASTGAQIKSKPNRISQKKRRLNQRRKG